MARWPLVSLGRYSRQPLAASYVDRAATDAQWPIWQPPGKQRNTRPYLQRTGSSYTAVENPGVFSSTTLNFISELGRRICVHTGDVRETSYLFRRISIMLQHYKYFTLVTAATLQNTWLY